MNKSPNKALIAECNALIQQIACLGRCVVCGKRAEAGHHCITRGRLFYLHMMENIAPLCGWHHTGTELSPHGTPRLWAKWHMENCAEQNHWLLCRFGEEIELIRSNQKRPVPDREALLATRDKLRAFLAAGKPYVFTEQEI